MTVISKPRNPNILSISDLKRDDMERIIAKTGEFKRCGIPVQLHNKILASCFFEPSTRTRLSFEAAMHRLGGKVIGFSEPSTTSMHKGESLADCIRVMGYYADVIILRHPQEGAARLAAEATATPIINAGDGSNQHPTQTLLDLYSIQESQSKLDGLHIAFAGDLRYSRTVHSLAKAAALFDMRMYFISPQSLMLPDEISDDLRRNLIRYSFHRHISDVIDKVDILYVTRLQKERLEIFNESRDFDYCVNYSMLKNVKKNLKIFHPLPRINEISPDIDQTPYAYYFEQAKNGLFVRSALLSSILGEEHA